MNDSLSPYGGEEILIEQIPVGYILQKYKDKCNVDVSDSFENTEYVYLYKCGLTGYRYWKPFCVAGKEALYINLSSASINYYRDARWEYSKVHPLLNKNHQILEVGCGRGYFLKSIEEVVKSGIGLEMNSDAIKNKVTDFQIKAMKVEDIVKTGVEFDVVCSFHVLEHIIQPKKFLENCISILKPDGVLIVSTPNFSYIAHQQKLDCFDLPPHHMGHYTSTVFQKIGKLLDLEVMQIFKQIRSNDLSIMVTKKNRKSYIFRVYKKAVSIATRIVFSALKEDGHTILVVFRKK